MAPSNEPNANGVSSGNNFSGLLSTPAKEKNGSGSNPGSRNSSPTPRPAVLTGNSNDYQNYTMQRIISEALERSNVGCNNRNKSPTPIKNGKESSPELNGVEHSTHEESRKRSQDARSDSDNELVIDTKASSGTEESSTSAKRMKV